MFTHKSIVINMHKIKLLRRQRFNNKIGYTLLTAQSQNKNLKIYFNRPLSFYACTYCCIFH